MRDRRKDDRTRYTFVPNMKNIFLLRQLGFVDGRNNRLRKERNLNDFINRLLGDFFESLGTNVELEWVRWEMKQLAKDHARIYGEIDRLQKIKSDLEKDLLEKKQDLMINNVL